MRLRFVALFALWALTAFPSKGDAAHAPQNVRANAGQTFPYTGYITDDDVYVRSGPGRNYYPTGKLQTGDKVEVYRHDPGGWYAIRPVDGSFTWVSGRYLEVGEDGLATTTADRVAARVGSQFSDIRDVIQVRLHRGEVVEVLGKKEFGSRPGSGTWYKIAPPSGEFRWVFGKFVDPDYHHSGVRKSPTGYSPLIQPRRASAQHVATTPRASLPKDTASAANAQPSVGQAQEVGESGEVVETAQRWSPPNGRAEVTPEQAETGAAPSTGTGATRGDAVMPVRYTNKFVEPAHDPSGTATLRRISPQEFQAELDEIDMELSIMLAEEPTVWELDEVVVRVQALLAEAETAVERGRARLLANKIAQSEEIKRRFDAINHTNAATERHNRQLADLGQARQSKTQGLASAGRFDGVGRLARVVPPKLGAPRYALLDEKGQVRWYVTPAPGVNMNYYLGRRIGVNGIRGYIADKRAQHVTAKHITPLETIPLR